MQQELVEQDRVVAFIDVLGFSEVMMSLDQERRTRALQLLHRISGYASRHGVTVQNLGIGAQISLDTEVTTFSDNVVLSLPVTDVSHRAVGVTTIMSASDFMQQLIQSIISIYWQGLHLGLLFRGGITFGRLYRDDKVVAGEALVRAVQLEKNTRWPRIEIDPIVLSLMDASGNPLLDNRICDVAVVESEGRYFLNSLAFHQGVWLDYNHFRKGDPKVTASEIVEAVANIRASTDAHVAMLGEKVAHCRADEEGKQLAEALLKWQWFKAEFEAAQQHDMWKSVRAGAERESSCTTAEPSQNRN